MIIKNIIIDGLSGVNRKGESYKMDDNDIRLLSKYGNKLPVLEYHDDEFCYYRIGFLTHIRFKKDTMSGDFVKIKDVKLSDIAEKCLKDKKMFCNRLSFNTLRTVVEPVINAETDSVSRQLTFSKVESIIFHNDMDKVDYRYIRLLYNDENNGENYLPDDLPTQ